MFFDELEKLRKRVLKYPKQYRQEFWGYGKNSHVVQEQRPACKTAGCLAFNTVVSHGYRLVDFSTQGETSLASNGKEIVEVGDKAQEILGLTSEQGSELFGANAGGWSRRAYDAYHHAKTPTQRAQAAAMAIEDFVAKYRAIEAYGARLKMTLIDLGL